MERAVYRIIDANFNRTREGLRVIEEYCRFALESPELSAAAKQLRHRLCDAITNLDADKLLACRDSVSDVGRGMKIDKQLARKDLRDCFAAAAKRVPEALRALAETTQTIDAQLAQTFEALRFSAYTLEKDVVLAEAAHKFKSVKLYVLITVTPETSDAQVLDLTNACAAGGADCLQLRAKGLADDRIFALAADFTRICAEHDVLSIINDRTDISVAASADGVHLGQNDIPLAAARKLQQKPMIFGVSTHTTDQLKATLPQKPDYVALGPVFPTETKPAEPTAGIDYIENAMKILATTDTPHVAIGGITTENIQPLLKAGIGCVAVCSAVTNAPDPRKACTQFAEILRSHH